MKAGINLFSIKSCGEVVFLSDCKPNNKEENVSFNFINSRIDRL